MTTATISKLVTVMDYFSTTYNTVNFITADEDTQQIQRQVLMTVQTWEKLGSPEQITVTIVPGDKLNKKPKKSTKAKK